MPQLYPEVKDATTLGPRFSQPLFLPIGVEGQAAVAGSALVGTPVKVSRPADADTLFGSTSTLSALVKFLLSRGIPEVTAVASILSASLPSLVQRQAAWAFLEADQNVRIRLSDTLIQAEIVALAQSAVWAEGVNNKQIAFGGMPAGTSSATLLTAASAIASKRGVLVGPGIYDSAGTLLSGMFAAAAVAAEVAKNADIADDLDTAPIPGLTGIEKDVSGMTIFRIKANAGTPVNDFETLLTGGVSPLRTGRNGGVEITHLRTTFTTDSTFDALMTRLIIDQLFIDVRNYVEANNFLRRGNTLDNRNDLKAGVEALLAERSNWVLPVAQPDGTPGYGVAVSASLDNRQVTVAYTGQVVRGIQTVLVDAQLTIPA